MSRQDLCQQLNHHLRGMQGFYDETQDRVTSCEEARAEARRQQSQGDATTRMQADADITTLDALIVGHSAARSDTWSVWVRVNTMRIDMGFDSLLPNTLFDRQGVLQLMRPDETENSAGDNNTN